MLGFYLVSCRPSEQTTRKSQQQFKCFQREQVIRVLFLPGLRPIVMVLSCVHYPSWDTKDAADSIPEAVNVPRRSIV